MTADANSTKSAGGQTLPEEDKSGAQGWLAALRARFGLQGPQTLRDTIEYALKEEDRTATSFSAEERGMLLRLLRFGASRVEDIMVPRADIISAEESEPLTELLKTFMDAGVSRVPVYHDTLDDPRGMIHVKDLYRWLLAEAGARQDPAPVPGGAKAEAGGMADLDLGKVDLSRPISASKLRRQVLFVPPSMPAMNLLIRMQTTRIHMALVVDEYGGTDGLVTIEDLVEQIVGDIEDEHDEAEAAHITRDPRQGLVAAARTPIQELEELVGRRLLDENNESDIDTLGGLVFAIVGRVPARGEIVRHASGVEFEVLDADPRRVKKLKINLPASVGAPAEKPAPK